MSLDARQTASFAVLFGVALACGRGCGAFSPSEAAPLDSGLVASEMRRPEAASPEASRVDSSPEAALRCPAGIAPPGTPAGWQRWEGYDACCGFYVPSSRAELPEPVQWTTCDASVQPSTAICKQMLVDWQPPSGSEAISPWISAYVDGSGGAQLQISRLEDGRIFRLIGAADGSLSQALLETNTGRCTLGQSALNAGLYAFLIFENKLVQGGGALAGSATDLAPRGLLRFADNLVHALVVGRPGVLDTVTMRLYAPGSRVPLSTIGDPSDGNLSYGEHAFAGDALFWNAGSSEVSKLKVWTEAQGSHDLLSFGADTTQGASDLASDGHDLVWAQASGRTTGTGHYPSVSLMTSPFTTNSTQLTPRRLRSESTNAFGASPFVVGCGYAARATGIGIRVVRLADGASWFLSADPQLAWRWETPLAVTCSELFVRVGSRTGDARAPHTVLARVRLDSLGSSTPPD